MADKKKILVIDDDTDILDSTQTILEGKGFGFCSAKTGEEGLKAVDKCKPDLILCDMMMESIDAGMQTAKKIKEKASGIPVYLFSSVGDSTAANIDVNELGFNGVFQKPVDPDVLIPAINKSLGL